MPPRKMDHGRFLSRCVGSRKKVDLLLTVSCLGLLLVTVLLSTALAATGVVYLPLNDTGFVQVEFSDFAGVTMNGQTLSVDFKFEGDNKLGSGSPVSSEVFFQTGPHNSVSAYGDFPYD